MVELRVQPGKEGGNYRRFGQLLSHQYALGEVAHDALLAPDALYSRELGHGLADGLPALHELHQRRRVLETRPVPERYAGPAVEYGAVLHVDVILKVLAPEEPGLDADGEIGPPVEQHGVLRPVDGAGYHILAEGLRRHLGVHVPALDLQPAPPEGLAQHRPHGLHLDGVGRTDPHPDDLEPPLAVHLAA